MHTLDDAAGETAVGTVEDILRRAAAVPARTAYPTVDALNAEMEQLRSRFPELMTAVRIGTSRLGDPITLYTVQGGEHSALIVGGVHPNEPVGSLTVLHLAEQLLTDEPLRAGLQTTWHLVTCIDPDGMRLNEGWFADPSDRVQYAKEFYRPAPDEQVEWTFPFDYKTAYFDAMMPETQALARAIDQTAPELYVPLHNAEAGGAYYYLSRPAPGLYQMLHDIPESLGVPLDKGEPEGAHYTQLAPAIFEMGTLEDIYDFVESLGVDPYPAGSAGDASTSYAQKYGTFSLIAELPQWAEPASADTTLTADNYADALRRSGDALVEAGASLSEILAAATPLITLDTPLMRAARVFAPMVESNGRSSLARADAPESDRPATVAELHGLEDIVRMSKLRFGGILARALQAESATGLGSAELRRLTARTTALFAGWCADAAATDTARALPLAAVAGVQYGAILAAWAEVLQDS